MVVDTEMTREEVVLAFRTSLVDGGWPSEWAETIADDNLEIAAQLSAGTIIIRELEQFLLRGALFQGPGVG